MLNHISGALKLRRVILVGTWYYVSFENEALVVAGLALLFCEAVIMGFM
jgi:hypothetical protein